MTSMAIIIFSFIALMYHAGDCKLLATGNFAGDMVVTPTSWGLRLATARCDLSFPGDTATAGNSFIFMRFNVKYLSFTYYIAFNPDPVTYDSKSKWLILRSDYTYSNTLTNNFAFHFGEYLSDDIPQGDCRLYDNYTEAFQYSQTVPDISDQEAERLVGNSSFNQIDLLSTNNGYETWRVQCRSDIHQPLGLYEAHTYVNLNIPVYNVTSLYGTEMLVEDVNATWYFGRYQSHVSTFLDEAYMFEVAVGVTGFETGYCYVYAVTNTTLEGIIASLPGAVNVTAPTTPVVITYVIDAAYNDSGLRQMMVEYPSMRSQMMCNVTGLWSKPYMNILSCARRCLSDPRCYSVFHVTDVNTCYAHPIVYSKGDCDVQETVYYVVL